MKYTNKQYKTIKRILDWINEIYQDKKTPVQISADNFCRKVGRSTDEFPAYIKSNLFICVDEGKLGRGLIKKYFVNTAFYNILQTQYLIWEGMHEKAKI